MIWIDYIIIALIGLSTLISLMRGFFCEAFSLFTWGCAFFVANHFYRYLAGYLTYFEDALARNGIAIVILFISILAIGIVSSNAIYSLIKKTGLSYIDRVLGICFGALRGILIVAIILFTLDTFTSFSQSRDWKQSQLIPQFNYIIRWFFVYLKSSSNFLSAYLTRL